VTSGPRAPSSQRIPLAGAPLSTSQPAAAPTPDERANASVELGGAFELGAAELGFAAASWTFLEQIAGVGGEDAVRQLRDDLGRLFPVLDFVATRWLAGERRQPVDTRGICEALGGVRRVLVVGIEAFHLDALVRDLDRATRIGLLTYRLQRVDWERVLANYAGRVEPVDLAEFQGWAGLRSALLTFVYGTRGDQAAVVPAFMRVSGADVRAQFREIVGWDVLGDHLELYPRYLVETFASELTTIVPAGSAA
jgi:hypothetical protein